MARYQVSNVLFIISFIYFPNHQSIFFYRNTKVPPTYYNINNVWNPPGNIAEIVARQRAERAKLPKKNHSYVPPHYKGL
jgi:hypothetical protein